MSIHLRMYQTPRVLLQRLRVLAWDLCNDCHWPYALGIAISGYHRYWLNDEMPRTWGENGCAHPLCLEIFTSLSFWLSSLLTAWAFNFYWCEDWVPRSLTSTRYCGIGLMAVEDSCPAFWQAGDAMVVTERVRLGSNTAVKLSPMLVLLETRLTMLISEI